MAKKPKNDNPIPGAETRPAEGDQTRGAQVETKGAETKSDGAATENEPNERPPAPAKDPKPTKADIPEERRVEPGSQVEFRVVSQFIENGRLYQKDEGCALTPERARQLGPGLVEPFPK